MKTLNFSKDEEVLLIIPNSIRFKILERFNHESEFLNYKIMSLEELRQHVYFSYDVNAVLYLMNNYSLNKDSADEILENLYYIEEDSYDNEKLSFLSKIKKELISKNLLLFDEMFIDYIKRKKIIVYGYSKIDKFYKNMLDSINAIVIDDEFTNKKHDVYILDTLEKEVEFVFNEISKLIDNGVDINKIKLANVSDEYLYTIRVFSNLYNIPVAFSDNYIYSAPITKKFLSLLEESRSFFAALEITKVEFDMSNYNNLYIHNALFKISNKYNDLGDYPFDVVFNAVLQEIKQTKLIPQKKKNQIELVNINNNMFENDEYVFLLGFNQGIIPSFFKDDDYISDYLKEKYNLLLSKTVEKNKLEKQSIISSINKIENLTITCKLKSINEEFMISNLANELDYNKIYPLVDYSKIFSSKATELSLAKRLDDFIKYGIKSDELILLYSNFNIDYLSYNNSFTGIDNNKLLNKLSPKLTLSYTHIDNYFHCAFKYYLTNLLKLDKYEENFNTTIGNLFHYILSICFKKDFDYDYEYEKYIKTLELTPANKFFLKKLKKELKLVIEQVKKLQDETGLTKLLLEHKINIDKTSIIPVVFTGVVDKIMYKEKEKTLVSIIDYKTGNTSIDLYNVVYGLGMQLPIYLYLTKNSNLFNNIKFTGFYLQKILSNEINFSVNKTYLEQKYDNLKLEGYSTDDISDLEVFIPDYENSKFVKSMKTTSKGFYTYAKVLNNRQIENLINVVDSKIDEARDNILSGNFSINPKQIGLEKVGCNFCKFKDICYRNEKDFIKYPKNESLDFLGGEDNA